MERLKMVPAEISQDTKTTSSERRVFTAFEKSGIDGIALHSLNLPTHAYKLTSELDFVLLLGDIVLVVEVKGAHVACAGGVWTYSDHSGNFRQDSEGPFKQVISGMHALRDRLRSRMGPLIDDIRFGFLVVTTDVDLAISSFEWDAETYCGRGEFNRNFPKAVEAAAKYWRIRQPNKLPMTRELRTKILDDLRPDFDRSPLLAARASTLDLAFVQLTDEQFDRLDLISDSPRVICGGGAGTGKTFLAMEVARRQALAGRSVLLTCRSVILASFIRSMLAGSGVSVFVADEIPGGSQFDVVVIDEAQDLMNFGALEHLEGAITGGLSDGRWVMFMDQNRQAHLYGDFDPDALHFLQSIGPVPATLRRNCRNTREIVFNTRAFTGADTGVSAAGAGPEVQFVTVSDVKSESAALEAHLRMLREQEVSDGDVTIVSMRGDWETTAARDLRAARKGKLRRLDENAAADWPGHELTWASAVDIKGLENRFVCVIDIDSLESESDIDLLYVTMSRPRAGLWMATKPEIAEKLSEMYKVNAPAALEAFKGVGA